MKLKKRPNSMKTNTLNFKRMQLPWVGDKYTVEHDDSKAISVVTSADPKEDVICTTVSWVGDKNSASKSKYSYSQWSDVLATTLKKYPSMKFVPAKIARHKS